MINYVLARCHLQRNVYVYKTRSDNVIQCSLTYNYIIRFIKVYIKWLLMYEIVYTTETCYSVMPHGLVLATQHSVHCTGGNQDDALLLYNKSHLSGRQFWVIRRHRTDDNITSQQLNTQPWTITQWQAVVSLGCSSRSALNSHSCV